MQNTPPSNWPSTRSKKQEARSKKQPDKMVAAIDALSSSLFSPVAEFSSLTSYSYSKDNQFFAFDPLSDLWLLLLTCL
ncbi:hypothetical protein SDJN02_24673, partial [Cucurbita argyrosperma subsp. argyrosperma]